MLSLAALVLTPALAMAKPDLKIHMTAEKEITVMDNGKEVTKRVPTLKIDSGANLYFTLRIKNDGDEKATNVVVDNPIPAQTVYIDGSAGGKDSKVLFSIDHGKTFAAPNKLTYQFTKFNGEKETRTARPDMYTDIRWVVQDVPAGAQGDLFFQVKVD